MKKVLATVAALGLVFGVAANAMALDQPARASEAESTTQPRVPEPTAPGVALWSVAGQWVLAGAYLNKGYGAPFGAAVNPRSVNASEFGGPAGADAAYIYSFKILPVLQVNDKIAMKGELRFVDRSVLGWSDLGREGSSVIPERLQAGQDTNMKLYHVYMEWTSPYGKTRFGRTPAGAWGTSKFTDSTRQGQRLMWWPNMLPENWSALIFTEKLQENDAANLAGLSHADADLDAYYIGLSYKAPFGPTNSALWMVRNAANLAEITSNRSPWTSANLWLNGKYQFAPILLEWELSWGFGEAGYNSNDAEMDQKSLSLMVNGSMQFGDFTAGGLFLYCSGDSTGTDGDAETACGNDRGTGRDYNPYQIMMGDYMNLWNADNPLSGNTIHPSLITSGGNVGLWSIGAYGKFAMSPALSLTGEIGYFAAAEEPGGWDDEFGLEFGIGMGYKLMDNLMYNAHFSYLMTGDYFKEGTNNLETEDIYLVAHALSMKF